MTRQYEWQLKQRAAEKCIICGRDAVDSKRNEGKKSWYCEFHRRASNIRTREAQRSRHGWVSRYQASESYLYG